ncbi:MAG TPA: rRNA maturation RNase YbeY [Clostridiales bacterium]|nr:rRNA maturation RNase YbeY [Clostridiales bacterium]
MTLLIDNHQDIVSDIDELQEFFETVLKKTLEHVNADIDAEVSLMLTNNEEIRTLNREYRQKDTATDVLSFPLIDLDPVNQEDWHAALHDNAMPDTGEVVLGDIVISVEKAREQAAEYGHGLKRELGFLMVHGLLHLLGYDHEKNLENEDIMNQLQETILQELNLPRK